MDTGIVIALVGVLSTILSSTITYILSKRKYNAEVDSQVIQNLEKSVNLYIKICDNTTKKLQEYERENADLRNKIMALEKQVTFLKGNLCFKADCKYRTLEDKQEEVKHETTGKKNSKEA